MNASFPVAELARSVWADFRRTRRALIIFEVLFKLLEVWLLVPAVALVLAVVLARTGRTAVSDWDILDFLRSPLGLLYAAVFGVVAVASLLFEQAGIMVIAARFNTGRYEEARPVVRAAVGKTLRIIQLGAVQAGLMVLAMAPFVVLLLLTHHLFLSDHDIYFYLTTKPPAFWQAAGIGGIVLLAAVATGAWLYVRWVFALPVLLFENAPAGPALRASRDRVCGVAWRVGGILLGWHLAMLLVGLVFIAGFRFTATAVLNQAGERPTAVIVLLLLAQGGLLATVSFVTVVGQGLLTRRLYLARGEQLGISPAKVPDVAGPPSPWPKRLAYLSLAVALLAPLALWADLTRAVAERPPVRVTAHRGHARAAPENTLSAIRKTIDSGADYAEIDVHQTADGVIVLLHDRDLKRVAGVSRRLDELTYAEVRQLDVGSWFDPAFAGEPVPTLAEAIDLARGRIKLNIELKTFGPDLRLAGDVARLVRDKHFEAECLVTSFSLDALTEMKREDPNLRTGLIVATALGDLSRVEVDALSVRADHLTDGLLRDAHRRGREVHVWTVNDPPQMTRLMQRGVDNIITSDPDLLIRTRDEWAGVTGAERLVLASRLLLGLNP